MTTSELLQRLECGRGGCACHATMRRGHGLTHCPGHDDVNPSLAVTEADGKTLWRCHAGCSQDRVATAIADLDGRQPAFAPGAPAQRVRGRQVATYDYLGEDRRLLYQVVRYEPKNFKQRRPTDRGDWSWNVKDVPKVLYRLPELLEARLGRRVLLVEGEKDVDQLRALGFLAVTYAGGVNAPWEPAWTELFRGRKVAIIPDADRPGLAKARTIARLLVGVADEVRVVELVDNVVRSDHGEDVSDWIRAGHGEQDIKDLVASAPLFNPEQPPDPPSEQPVDEPRADDETPGDLVTNSPLVVRTMAELRGMPTAELHWMVERFLARGAVTELTAYIKAGKSTVSAQLMASVLHGERFLAHFPATKAPVVLLTEEPPVSLMPELEDAGVDEDDLLHLVLWSENGRLTWAEAAGWAAALAREVGAGVVVIDTLSIWASVEKENDADQAREAMRWILHLASQGVAVLVLRHARKSGGEVHNAGRGSSAYGGAADVLMHLDYEADEKGHPQEDDSRRVLRLKSRLDREQPKPMHLDYHHGRYVLPEKPLTHTGRLANIKRNVLMKLDQQREPVTLTELLQLAPCRRSAMIQALDELVKDGQVIRGERKNAGHPHRYSVVPGTLPLQGITGTDTPAVGARSEAGAGSSSNAGTTGNDGNDGGSRAHARGVVPAGLTGQLGKDPMGTTAESPPVVPSRSQAPGNDGAPVAQMPSCPTCGPMGYEVLGRGRRRCHKCKKVWETSAAEASA